MDQLVDPAGGLGPAGVLTPVRQGGPLDARSMEDIESEPISSAREAGWGCGAAVAFVPAPDDSLD